VKAAAIALAGVLASASPAGASPSIQMALADGSGWVSPGHLGNRPAVLLFWDSRCPPCIVELANISLLQRQFTEAVFITVSLSSAGESQRILSRLNLPETVVRARAPKNPQGLLASLGNVSGALPFAAAFNAGGRQCSSVGGELSPNRAALLRARCTGRGATEHANEP
jgi:hypothetical protein